MMDVLHLYLFSFIMILVHEFGHFLAAKKEGNYKGWGVFPNPHIKLTQPHGSRWGYSSGLAASLFLYPYWVLIQGWGYPHVFLAFCLAGASFDLIWVIFYGRLMKRRRARA